VVSNQLPPAIRRLEHLVSMALTLVRFADNSQIESRCLGVGLLTFRCELTRGQTAE
jgi:hypothetical protein